MNNGIPESDMPAVDEQGRNYYQPPLLPDKETVVLDTTLNGQAVAWLPTMNGRQGIDNRDLPFIVMDGLRPHDLSTEDISFYGKDYQGAVKIIDVNPDITSPSGGRFTATIPAIVYDAPGTYRDAYFVFTDKQSGKVTSSINIGFKVLANGLQITSGQSRNIVQSINSFIEEQQSRITNLLPQIKESEDTLQLTHNLVQQYLDLMKANGAVTETELANTLEGVNWAHESYLTITFEGNWYTSDKNKIASYQIPISPITSNLGVVKFEDAIMNLQINMKTYDINEFATISGCTGSIINFTRTPVLTYDDARGYVTCSPSNANTNEYSLAYTNLAVNNQSMARFWIGRDFLIKY